MVSFLEDQEFYKRCAESDRRAMLAPFNLPAYLATQICTDMNGYFGCRSSYGIDNKLCDLSIWFRCLTKTVSKAEEEVGPEGKNYHWHEMGFFVRWCHTGICRVLSVGTPPLLRLRLEIVLRDASAVELRDPFSMIVPLLDQLITQYDESAWQVRDQVRGIEMSRGTRKSNFVTMHDIARHTGHLVEVSAATVETMNCLVRRQERIYAELSSLDRTYKEQAHEYLSFQLQMMKSLQRRALSIQERINAEISLGYNIIATQDSMVTRSIGLLTMVFLPATFVSALFSTTFFSFAEETWKISKKFWIYWAVAVPSTLVVLIVWWLTLRRASARNRWR
ncbi:hypothetical protein HIM_10577 [Hirsutella minnesotensis 3608]|uniref:Uncharacterized protein n=1 Tax=Hirsutella minnesotensis 3608 TaxID=1043627 RepID=A0A0F7ZG00_9HYPO|nr:hypothetical protein HIM_10577 [Hirsutella minnesotensis 3608]